MKALDELLGFGNRIIDRLWPDPVKKEEAKLKLAEMHQTGELAVLQAETSLALGQIEINKEEAKSENWFVAGWRPFVGWVCGFTLFYAALFEPLLRFISVVVFKYSGPFPEVDTMLTLQVLLGLLGLGGLRTWEKKNGVAR